MASRVSPWILVSKNDGAGAIGSSVELAGGGANFEASLNAGALMGALAVAGLGELTDAFGTAGAPDAAGISGATGTSEKVARWAIPENCGADPTGWDATGADAEKARFR
jgi:hypothetical protein